MTIPRSPDFPEEAAQLFEAFVRCTAGHSTAIALEAAANLLAATILIHAREAKMSVPDIVRYAGTICENTAAAAISQWNGESRPSAAAQTN